MKVYLAGPVTGTDYAGCTDWRTYASRALAPAIEAVSPLRAKDYLRSETAIANAYDTVLSCAKGITTRDRWDAQRCDVLLAHLAGAERVSIGTVMEIAWADAARRPIVLTLDSGSVHDHAMLREVAGFIVPTLEDALDVVRALAVPA